MNQAVFEAQNRIKNKRNLALSGKEKKQQVPSNYITNLFTRTLISVILVLGCAIFVNLKDENLLFFKNHVFHETLAFTKANELYTKYFGSIVPDANPNTIPVFNDNRVFSKIEAYNDSYKANMNLDTLSTLESGIVVFAGEKENFGQTVIIQGIDGVDIWYSNLVSSSVTMYDYIEKGTILGEVNNKEAILTFMENGAYIGYEKYISETPN